MKRPDTRSPPAPSPDPEATPAGSASPKKTPNPIDRHVGSRVRMRRMLIGVSQEKLGTALGLTFQQVQKYEKGTNRIGASRLQQISQILGVAPAFFFEDLPGDRLPAGGFADEGAAFTADFLSTSEGVLLNKAFQRIRDARVRKRIVDLVTALADDGRAGADQPRPAPPDIPKS